MTATLRVTRETAFGFELRRGVFDISIDGNRVESVNNDDTIESPLAPDSTPSASTRAATLAAFDHLTWPTVRLSGSAVTGR